MLFTESLEGNESKQLPQVEAQNTGRSNHCHYLKTKIPILQE